MPIETEWDPLHAERLIYLQTRLRKPLPEVLAAAIDLAMANHDRTGPIKPSVWEARTRFEQERGAFTEDCDLPPRHISAATWRNPLDDGSWRVY